MAVLRITKEFRYEGAHALPGYDGKCRNIHGHSYVLYVTVKGETRTNGEGDTAKEGMIVDFKVLKGIVEENIIDVLDHALLLRQGTPLANELALQDGVWLPLRHRCGQHFPYFAGFRAQP